MKGINNNIWDIIAASINGETLTEKENADFKEWLDNDPDNLIVYRSLEQYVAEQTIRKNIDVEAAFKIVRREINQKYFIRKKEKLRYWGIAASFLAAAAVVTLFLILPFNIDKQEFASVENKLDVIDTTMVVLSLADGRSIMLDKLDSGKIKNRLCDVNNSGGVLKFFPCSASTAKGSLYNKLETPRGKDYQIVLEDGTKVWLSAGSRLTFPVSFGENERRIYLEGEACFEVTKAPDRPFIVKTKNIDVKVLGTYFDVRAYNDEGVVYTTLVNGSVQVFSRDSCRQPVLLLPCQQYSFDLKSKHQEVIEVDPYLYIAWIDDMFVFKNKRIEDVMQELERWYEIDYEFIDKFAADIRISGNIEHYETIDVVMELLGKLKKVKVNKREGKYIICSI